MSFHLKKISGNTEYLRRNVNKWVSPEVERLMIQRSWVQILLGAGFCFLISSFLQLLNCVSLVDFSMKDASLCSLGQTTLHAHVFRKKLKQNTLLVVEE